MAYITAQNVEAILGRATLIAIFDDSNVGMYNPASLGEVITHACSMVDSYLARVYSGPFPIAQSPTPDLIRIASLAWVRALAYERHPEYVRRYGESPRKEAHTLCERLTEAKEFLNDLLAQPQPANVGGLTINSGPRMLVDSADGTYNGGDF